MRRSRFILLVPLAVMAACVVTRFEVPSGHAQSSSALRVMIVGGGPNLEHNQAAIESNVRYVSRILPQPVQKRTLFADGKTTTKDVLCEDSNHKNYFRAPDVPALDGPTNLASFQTQLGSLVPQSGADASAPILLYFTGHGSPGRDSRYENNRYDMWGGDELTVRKLAAAIEPLPKSAPITVVMCQCFSGAFGNLMFRGGEPDGIPVDRPICGFFASIAQRPAAGCTPEINEANYRDFTGYFFAALTGVDRVGRKVTGADYNHDGQVGGNEAFAYTLIHDDSIDTPVCTSDVFLRRFVKTPDAEIAQTSYTDLLAWATPAQHAALEGLSETLKATTDDRFARLYRRFRQDDGQSEDPVYVHTLRFVRLAKSIALAHILLESDDANLKSRYTALVRQEARSPFDSAPLAIAPNLYSHPVASVRARRAVNRGSVL